MVNDIRVKRARPKLTSPSSIGTQVGVGAFAVGGFPDYSLLENSHMNSKQPHHLAVALITALAFCFAAAVNTAPFSDTVDASHADRLMADLLAQPQLHTFSEPRSGAAK